MTAYTGTVTLPAVAGERGQQSGGLCQFTWSVALANTDTITFANAVPAKAQGKCVGFQFWSTEIDTNASPTALFTIGDGTDADGYLTSKGGGVGLQNSLAGQLMYFGDGALIGTATQASRNIVVTITAAVATGSMAGTLFIRPIFEGL